MSMPAVPFTSLHCGDLMSRQFQVASRIKGQPNLVRPKVGGGVVNMDNEGYQRALARLRADEKRQILEARVGRLEDRLDRILDILEGSVHVRT